MRKLVGIALVAWACRSSQPASERAATGSAEPAAIAVEHGGRTHVRVDRRVEVISILQRLAGHEAYRRAPPTPYVRAVDAAFAPFADHPAVAATRRLRRRHSISWDAPMLLAVHLDARLHVVNAAELPDLDPRFAGVDVDAYAAVVREFATATKLDAFLATQRDHIKEVERALRAVVDAERPVDWFDEVFGARARTRYIVVPGLLTGSMNFGVRATRPDGTHELYQVMGVDAPSGIPVADDDLVALLVHELAHSYVNPVLAKHRAALEAAGTKLYARVDEAMQAQAYGDWTIMLNEAIVRAVTVRYLRERKGAAAGRRARRAELRRGFVWTAQLEALLARLPDPKAPSGGLDAFMPQVIAILDALASDDAVPPFAGPFTMVLWRDPVWILPPPGPLASYATQMADRFGPTAPRTRAATTALAAHRGRDVVTYGSPRTNPVVAAIARAAGWRIERGKIVLGARELTGDHLVLIACWPRPDAPGAGAAVYAAADDADLVGVNAIPHGGTDWLVARREANGTFVVLDEGDFAQGDDGAWRLP